MRQMCQTNQGRGVGAAIVVAAIACVTWTGVVAADRHDNRARPELLRTDRGGDEHAYGELPLAFVENRGQTDRSVRYYVQRSRSAFFLTDRAIIIALTNAGMSPSRGGVALALEFVGRHPDAMLEGRKRAAGHVNYLRGTDPSRWHTGVPRFQEVVYRQLWPGIDLVLRGTGAALKYEFRLRPGARPSDIRLSYAGGNGLRVDPTGALLIDTAVGAITDSPPVSWQEIDGARVPVESRYALPEGTGATVYGFAVGSYDEAHDLVIDPGLDYSTFIGGSSMDRAAGIAVDSFGNAYVVGTTQSTDFPTTAGAFDRAFNGGITDVFVAKLNAAGTGLVYATYLGGSPTPLRRGTGDNLESGRAIAVDSGGHAYVTGVTDSSDFPTTSGAFQPALNATLDVATDAFVTKLNPSGSGLVYSTFLGGAGYDDGWNIALDDRGNAYVTGDTGSADFPTTSGAAQGTPGGGRDAFAAQLNATGSALVYGTYLGGADNEVGNGITVDVAGQVYVVGGSRSLDFPTTAGAFQPAHSGGAFADLFEAFVTKLNTSGGLVYSTFLGGTRIDIAHDVAADANGHAHVIGSTSSGEFPTTAGAFDRTSFGGFVTRLNAEGSALVYSTFLRGGGHSAIALDPNNAAWIVGTATAGAPTTADAFATDNRGGNDAWLGRLSSDGSTLEFGTFVGGTNTDNGVALALDGNANVYIAGTTMSADFPTTSGAFDTTFSGDPSIFWGDAYAARFGTGSGTVNPPETRTTTTFSGRLDANRAAFHTVQVGSPGLVDVNLNWAESRANLTLRVRNASGTQVFFDGTRNRPKVGSFSAASSGNYQIEIANVTSRRTSYMLSVTHPVANTVAAEVSFLSLNPTTVTGGTSSTGSVSLSAAAPAGGASVALSSSNTGAAAVPATVTIPEGLNSASFTISTNSVSANTTSTITASYNGTSRSATLTVNAPGGPTLATLSLQPTTVAGGSMSTGTVTLTEAAPAGGALVTLVSSNTDTATVPASVTVPEGSTAATFSISTSTVTFDSSSSISASHGGVTRFAILSVSASGGSTVTLSSVSVSPGTVTGGNSSAGTVTLTGAAPSGGVAVSLSSSHTAATVPASVTVAGGAASASFTVATSAVTASTPVTIIASAGGVTRSAALTVAPGPAASTASLTVTATGRSGERVLSNPAGIDVSVGTTGSASFPTGISITLSVTDERDAVWSGACSSGGNKRRTCTFTLNSDASVTANVQ